MTLYDPYNKTRLGSRLKAKRKIVGDCWLWTGGRTNSGHGRIGVSQNVHFVSRLAMYVYKDFDLHSDLHVLHKLQCKNPHCFNPDHLYIGTQADNRRDTAILGTAENQNSIKTHCRYGHEFSGTNLMILKGRDGSTHRRCRICHRNQVNKSNRIRRMIRDIRRIP